MSLITFVFNKEKKENNSHKISPKDQRIFWKEVKKEEKNIKMERCLSSREKYHVFKQNTAPGISLFTADTEC